jgi:hypothetical protein
MRAMSGQRHTGHFGVKYLSPSPVRAWPLLIDGAARVGGRGLSLRRVRVKVGSMT